MLEIGKVYIGRIIRRFGYNDFRDDHNSIMLETVPSEGRKNTICVFIENEPFLVIDEMAKIGLSTQFKILLNNKIYLLNYYKEEQTEFKLVC